MSRKVHLPKRIEPRALFSSLDLVIPESASKIVNCFVCFRLAATYSTVLSGYCSLQIASFSSRGSKQILYLSILFLHNNNRADPLSRGFYFGHYFRSFHSLAFFQNF